MRLRKILMVASVTFACVAQAQDLTIHFQVDMRL